MHIQVLPHTLVLIGSIATSFVIITILAALEDVFDYIIDLLYRLGSYNG